MKPEGRVIKCKFGAIAIQYYRMYLSWTICSCTYSQILS